MKLADGVKRIFSYCRCDRKLSKPRDPNEPRTDWGSLGIVSILCFFFTVQFSLYLTSLWPYLQQVRRRVRRNLQLDNSITETFLGLINGLCALGTAFANPAFGYWMNRLDGKARVPIIAGIIFTTVGSVAYLLVAVLPISVGWSMLVARFITGIGIGE